MMQLWLHYIKEQTELYNQNNAMRTKAYLEFYQKYPEVEWALLASFVSRNAGWNMTDLQTKTFHKLLSEKELKSLFLTYESANWFIFQDAYPQLLIFELSMKQKRPMFFLLKYFHVSKFMEEEWYHFYQQQHRKQLLFAQIINEQNLIQHPILESDPYEKKVFKSLPYNLQNVLYLNAVLLPTRSGDLYGAFVPRFKNVTKRIQFGKKLAAILFHPKIYSSFLTFAEQVEATGSREEYEQFLTKPVIQTPTVNEAFLNTKHTINDRRSDWLQRTKVKNKWFNAHKLKKIETIGDEFFAKRKMLARMTQTIEKAKHPFAEKK